MRGLPLEPLQVARTGSWLLATVLLLFILTAFNIRYILKLFGNYEVHVATESRTMLLLILQTSILEGIMFFCYYRMEQFNLTIEAAGVFCSMTLVYNLFTILMFQTTGFVFAGSGESVAWNRSQLASQAMFGLLLIIPVLVALIRPEFCRYTILVGLVFYVLARLNFIIKGWQIFYEDLSSWFYFILYLCTLEILPVVILWKISQEIAVFY